MIGGDFNTPVMYQDLANSTMPPMYMPFGGVIGSGFVGNTPYLGGIQMQRQLDHDKLTLMHQKENQDKSTMKKVLGAFVLILGLGSIPLLRKSIKKAGGFNKYLKNKWDAIINSFKGNKTSKPGFWQKIKNKFKRTPKP